VVKVHQAAVVSINDIPIDVAAREKVADCSLLTMRNVRDGR
jgi:hypothetical protein